jgi:hypothetical protein
MSYPADPADNQIKKVIVIGPQCGKNDLITTLANMPRSQATPDIRKAFKSKDGEIHFFEFSASSAETNHIRISLFSNADAILLCLDASSTARDTDSELLRYLSEIERTASENFITYLILTNSEQATRSPLTTWFFKKQSSDLALHYCEVSAVTNVGIDSLRDQLINDLLISCKIAPTHTQKVKYTYEQLLVKENKQAVYPLQPLKIPTRIVSTTPQIFPIMQSVNFLGSTEDCKQILYEPEYERHQRAKGLTSFKHSQILNIILTYDQLNEDDITNKYFKESEKISEPIVVWIINYPNQDIQPDFISLVSSLIKRGESLWCYYGASIHTSTNKSGYRRVNSFCFFTEQTRKIYSDCFYQ